MPQFPLTQGAYTARGVIANAQSCINLFPEPNPKDAPFPVTHYPASGTAVLCDYTGQYSGPVRGLYVASNGIPYMAIGQSIVRLIGIGTNPENVLLGTLPTDTGQPVSMCDNQTTLVIVDGSSGGGWQVPLASTGLPNTLTPINDPAFYGSNHVDFIDTFLVFNWPGTSTFYTTTSNAVTPFNPEYFAQKIGWNDLLIAARCLHDNIWLLGDQTTEVWYNAGADPSLPAGSFPFERMANSILQQGCVAPYSPVIADNAIYWLSQDRWGRNMVMRGEGYTAHRISNFAMENEWANYGAVSDCIGMAYQQAGHEIIGLYFPSANTWWGYDAATGQWFRRSYGDLTTAWLPRCTAFWGYQAAGEENTVVLAGDRTGPRILTISRNNPTDCGTPITRLRAWPHAVNDGKRQVYSRFAAAFDGSALSPDTVNLAWSDDGGHTFGNPVPQSCGNATNGQFQWRRLGYARDRVFQLSWTGQGEATLNGAFVDTIPSET